MHIIAGKYKNKTLLSPRGSLTRPTSGRLRETIFNICQAYILEARFLDLFAGSGAIGIEALSRGASSCIFVDNSRESLECIKANLNSLDKGSGKVLFGDVFAVLKNLIKQQQKFDIIFADPPYEKKGKSEGEFFSFSGKVLELVDQHPLLASGGFLFIEDARTFIPEVESLTTLKFISSRATGRTSLHQFQAI